MTHPLRAALRPAVRRAAPCGGLAAALALAAACASDPPAFQDVPPADELYEQGLRELEGISIAGLFRYVDYDEAIETFQTIIDNYPYSDQAVEAELRIADAYFEDGKWDEALSYYRDFAELHPNHEKVPYTLLRAALCHVEQVESPERDQTATRRALEALERLVRRFPYAPETREGEQLIQELRRRLARHIMDVGDFYRERGDFQAAASRYRSLLDGYPGLGLDAEALYKLGVSYEKMKRRDEALRLYLVIVENFGGSDIAAKASDRIAATR